MSEAALLELQHRQKSFDGTQVIRGITLTVRKGEFVTLLGPSGCGKTTTLRIVAGLTAPDSGSVILSGQDVTGFPPEKRNVNTVFQNYALFPHMSVARNIGYGLRLRHVDKREIDRRVDEMLELVQLPGYGNRSPAQLSGGQRQRVAIARAVVLRPDVLLLDEPLGALDLQLRQQMQVELKAIQQQLGITFIYITHDQEEALNMSDRIAIMSAGLFEQVGSPADIYERPETRFAARFIGQGTLMEGEVLSVSETQAQVRLSAGLVTARVWHEIKPGDHCAISIHAERIRFSQAQTAGFDLPATVVSHRYSGSVLRTELRLRTGEEITAVGTDVMGDLPQPGEMVFVHFNPRHCALIPGAAS